MNNRFERESFIAQNQGKCKGVVTPTILQGRNINKQVNIILKIAPVNGWKICYKISLINLES